MRACLSLAVILACTCGFAQDFDRLLNGGHIPYLEGRALLQARGHLTAGDCADLAVGDYDADGQADVLVGSAYGDLVLYRRLPDCFDKPKPLLSAAFSFAAGRLSRTQISPNLADLNDDGVLDLVLGAGPDLYYYSRKGGLQPGCVLRTVSDHSFGQLIGSSALAAHGSDLDGDGDTDLLIGDQEGRVWWAECLQADPIRLADPVLLGAGGKPLQVAGRARCCVGDWDHDTRLDVLVADHTGQVYFVRGRREGLAAPEPIFRDGARTPEGQPLRQLAPALQDVTGDGQPELLLGCRAGFVAIFSRQDKDPVFQGYLQAREVPIDVGRCAAPTACDWNGDGSVDLVSGAEDGLVRLYLRRPDGLFEPEQLVVGSLGPILAETRSAAGDRYSWPRVVDLNCDGTADLVLGSAAGTVETFLNQDGFKPTGTLRIGGDNIRSAGVSAITMADYDGDGDPDLFVGDVRPPDQQPRADTYAGPRFVLPGGGLSYYENELPKAPGMPLFLKGVRLASYIGKRGRATEEDALDASVLGLRTIEPLQLFGESWNFLIGTRAGYYVFNAQRTRRFYPAPMLQSADGIPNPLFPPLYSCTAAALGDRSSGFQARSGADKGLLCGLSDYGFICYYPPDQVPQLGMGARPGG